MRPTLRQLEYLLEVEKHASFSVAAEHCFVTQSTLSAGIKELEGIIGQQLVNRSRKAATLTPTGQEVANRAREILEKTDNMMSRIKTLENPMTGTMRLGIIPTIAPYILPDLLPRIRQSYPDMDLQLFEDLTERLLEQIDRGQIDAALMALPYDTPGMVQNILFEEPFVLAHSDKDDIPKKLSTKDLSAQKLLLLEDGHCLRDHALQACSLQIPRTRKTFSATSLSTLLQMVQHGDGVTLLPEMAAAPDSLPRGIKLSRFTGDKKPPSRQIGLVWPERSSLERNLKLLGELIIVQP